MKTHKKKTEQLPETLPMLPVRDVVIFPYMILPLYVGRESSIQAVETALNKDRYIFLSSQKDRSLENPNPESLYKVGTIAMIMRMRKLSDKRIKILIQGVAKGQITSFNHSQPFFSVSVKTINEETQNFHCEEVFSLIRTAKQSLEKIISFGRTLSPDILLVLDEVEDPGRLADLIASNLELQIPSAQKILETQDPKQRLILVNESLNKELEVLQVQARIKTTAKDEMSKSQREYFLREQMKAIKNELGDQDPKSQEIEELKTRIEDVHMPNETEKEAMKQLQRLERMHPEASEASMVRTYLDWMADLPWSKSSKDILDIEKSKNILEEDHDELQKAKERILEFLAVKKLRKNKVNGPILCFAGPPGVGKTSLGKSIARSMGREYCRISLGGIKDEAEIRGHRRTYVGAMPGKIIQALKHAKTNNPVMVLDEIDKLGSDFRGDPSAAMLEVLDPEQNSTFRDSYLNVDFDLSNIFFLATANILENIPAALRDRMEVIQISGYTQSEKLNIAKRHLLKKQIEMNGITQNDISFPDEGLTFLINHYTREAGLRNLNREIGAVCRKVAKKIVFGEKKKMHITSETLPTLLGAPRFLQDDALKEEQIGITTGMAWTPSGGQILYVEAIKMKGKGRLVLTGQLGDVMKESARTALSYAKSNRKSLGISESWFDENEVHVHFPAGAIPKDGPSAGVTISTSLISLMTDKSVRKDVAMTGEVTLTGRVLPVGGIKEKALAALSHGITTVIVPLANKKDVDEIPKELKSQINFIFAENLDEVLQVALRKGNECPASMSSKITATPDAETAA